MGTTFSRFIQSEFTPLHSGGKEIDDSISSMTFFCFFFLFSDLPLNIIHSITHSNKLKNDQSS